MSYVAIYKMQPLSNLPSHNFISSSTANYRVVLQLQHNNYLTIN